MEWHKFPDISPCWSSSFPLLITDGVTVSLGYFTRRGWTDVKGTLQCDARGSMPEVRYWMHPADVALPKNSKIEEKLDNCSFQDQIKQCKYGYMGLKSELDETDHVAYLLKKRVDTLEDKIENAFDLIYSVQTMIINHCLEHLRDVKKLTETIEEIQESIE